MGVRFPHPLQQDGPSRLSFFVIRAIIRAVELPPGLRAVWNSGLIFIAIRAVGLSSGLSGIIYPHFQGK